MATEEKIIKTAKINLLYELKTGETPITNIEAVPDRLVGKLWKELQPLMSTKDKVMLSAVKP